MNEHDAKLHETVGYIKGIVEGIDKKVDTQNGSIAKLRKTVTRHEVILGKVGMVFTVAIFVITTAFNIAIAWVKNQFS